MKSIFSIIPLLFILQSSFIVPAKSNLRDDVLKYTNEFRKSKRLPPLVMSDELNSIAEKHSRNMALRKVAFGHSGFNQRAAEVRRKLNDSEVAENVAFGVRSGREVVELWKSSSGHRKNMLGSFKYIGIGVATGSNGQLYYTQIFAD